MIDPRRATLQQLELRLAALSPSNVLQRGYAIVRQNDQVVTSACAITDDVDIEIEMNDGRIPARVLRSG